MKTLVLGADGQVGFELAGALACFCEVRALSRRQVDLANLASLREVLRAEAPVDAIVNAASYNDVDGAEADGETARRINADAVAVLGEEARRQRAALIHYSTDFVFSGTKAAAAGEKEARPYTEADAPDPIGAYGASKLAGERALLEQQAPALILRTAWVYSVRRKSFVSAILRLARERETLRVVADQVGNPTFCRDLAQATALLLYGARRDPFAAIDDARGVYHLAGAGYVSRHELAQAVVALDPRASEHKVRSIEPIPSSAYPLPARRPTYAPLDCARAFTRFSIRLPPWRESLARALSDRVQT